MWLFFCFCNLPSIFPWASNAMSCTESVWPLRVLSYSPVSKSQIFMVASSDDETIKLKIGWKRTCKSTKSIQSNKTSWYFRDFYILSLCLLDDLLYRIFLVVVVSTLLDFVLILSEPLRELLFLPQIVVLLTPSLSSVIVWLMSISFQGDHHISFRFLLRYQLPYGKPPVRHNIH